MGQEELMNQIAELEREIALLPEGSITKKKIKDNWTLVCDVNNILNQKQTLAFRQDDFTRRITTWGGGNSTSVRLGVSWSFKSGKAFNSKSIEKGGDSSRME